MFLSTRSKLNHSPQITTQLVLLLVYLIVSPLQAAHYLSHQLQHQTLVIKTDEGSLSLTAYNSHAFEVFYQPIGVKQLPSFAIAGAPEKTAVQVTHQSTQLIFDAGNIQAIIHKSPLRIRYQQKGKLLVEEELGLFIQDTTRGFRFKLQDGEKLLGGGQRILGMDRRGQRFPLYNRAHYGYTTESQQMYFGLSAVMSDRHYALVFDNSAKGMMDLAKSEPDIMQFDAVAGRTAYIIVAGQNYPELIQHFTQVTGRQPLPPRWALGNFASRFGYRSEQQTRDTVDAYFQQDFPLDAVVLDLYWFGPDIKGHMGNLSWDRNTFPTPEKMIADFASKGVNTVLITEPFILSTSNNWQAASQAKALAVNHIGQPQKFDFYFGNTGLVDVFSDAGQNWFANVYQDLFQQGVTGWWGDLGEPEVHPADIIHDMQGTKVTGDEIHNAYGHQWAKLVYQTQQQLAPDTRPMLMMRSGFVGSQRYGMLPWTGDVSRSWQGLKPQVELSLQMSMLGLAYTHSDLGGFAGGEIFDPELYTRWMQYGVFQPVYRPHGQDNIAPEPVFHDHTTQNIVRKFIKLRYQLLPYNYSLVYENSLTGMPLMRPMMFTEAEWFDEKDQYMWGDAFLVKPLTDPAVTSVDVRLPQGVWFDFWNDKAHQGGKTIELPTTLETLPVLVKAGAFVPMANPMQSTSQYDNTQLQLHYYADKSVPNSQATMYEDDGSNPQAITQQQFQTLQFTAHHQPNYLAISASVKGKFDGAPKKRHVTLIIHNWTTSPTSIRLTIDGAEKETVGKWDRTKQTLTIEAELADTFEIKIK